MKLVNKIVFFMVIFGLVMIVQGCTKHVQPPERIITTETQYIEVPRDTTIYTPADSSAIEALFACDSMNRVFLKEITKLEGEQIRSNQSYEQTPEGDLRALTTCEIDSLEVYLQWKETHTTVTQSDSTIIYRYREPETREPDKTPVWPWMSTGAAIMLSIVVILKRVSTNLKLF